MYDHITVHPESFTPLICCHLRDLLCKNLTKNTSFDFETENGNRQKTIKL